MAYGNPLVMVSVSVLASGISFLDNEKKKNLGRKTNGKMEGEKPQYSSQHYRAVLVAVWAILNGEKNKRNTQHQKKKKTTLQLQWRT